MSEQNTVVPHKLANAVYNFKGANNDELNFNKGDLITITQVIEGGWWEGTLNGKTGWFPSNYVKEVQSDPRAGAISPTPGKSDEEPTVNKTESVLFYHNVVLQSVLETERQLVNDLQTILRSYLRPLEKLNVLTNVEYSQLVGNLEEITALHQNILTALTNCDKQPMPQQRIGGMFLKQAASLRSLYEAYCRNHPRAVEVLQRKKDALSAYMEQQGAPPPGIMKLTTSLSVPFTRLEKYSSLLKELERHTDEGHVDRGDTQRAISVYRNISLSCTQIRRQKDLEREIMSSPIHQWEGEDITKLGEVLLMSHLRIESENGERKDRLFLLFPGVLVMLSVSHQPNGYIYEGKYPTSGMKVDAVDTPVRNDEEENDEEEEEHKFFVTGSLMERRLLVICSTKKEQTQWTEGLADQAKHGPVYIPTKPQSLQISTSHPAISQLSQQAKTAQVLPYKPQRPPGWTIACLRPCPPIRPPTLFLKEDASQPKSPRSGRKGGGGYPYASLRKKPVEEMRTLEDDAILLKVIEAYCTSAKTRHTVNSSLLDSPQVLVAEEEKIIVEELMGDTMVMEERSLVDTVYLLRDTVKDLQMEQARLRKDLDEERKSRKQLENIVLKLRTISETQAKNAETITENGNNGTAQ